MSVEQTKRISITCAARPLLKAINNVVALLNQTEQSEGKSPNELGHLFTSNAIFPRK